MTYYLEPDAGPADSCIYCGAVQGQEEPELQHLNICPRLTNYWAAITRVNCELCNRAVAEGEQYRLLPALPEDELLSGTDPSEPIKQSKFVVVVCVPCSRLRIVHSSPVAAVPQDSTFDPW